VVLAAPLLECLNVTENPIAFTPDFKITVTRKVSGRRGEGGGKEEGGEERRGEEEGGEERRGEERRVLLVY